LQTRNGIHYTVFDVNFSYQIHYKSSFFLRLWKICEEPICSARIMEGVYSGSIMVT
jgi:hypothetical protein